MSAPKPNHYDDLDRALADAWRLLEQGAADRSSPLRTPVLVTVGAEGGPTARTVILRAVDRIGRRLRVHSDARSRKVEEIGADGRVAFVFHHPVANVQLRLAGLARARVGGADDRAAWDDTPPPVKRAYMTEKAPGTPSPVPTPGFPAAFAGRPPTAEESQPAWANFAVVETVVHRLEWLYLNPDGHRRALFEWPDGTLRATWLVP